MMSLQTPAGTRRSRRFRGALGFTVRAVGSQGEGGYHRRGKGRLAKIAEYEAAGTSTILKWNGDMLLWGDVATKSKAFRTAVESKGGGD